MGVFIGYFDEVSKSFVLDFISLVSVSSTKPEILIEKIKEIMMNCGTDITKTRFVCFNGANLMNGEKSDVRDAIKMMHLSQYMSTVDATGYYILNY